MIGYMLGGKLFNLIKLKVLKNNNFKKIINYKILILFFFVKISYYILIDLIFNDPIFN